MINSTQAATNQAASHLPKDLADEGLITRIVAGDSSAERELYERHHQRLVAYVRSRCGNLADAEDYASDVWVLALSKIRANELENRSAPGAFLRGIARRQMANEFRKRKRRGIDYSTEHVEKLACSPSPSPDANVHFAQVANAMVRTLSRLPVSRDREVLIGKFIHQETADYIGLRLGLDRTQVHKVASRARTRLIRALAAKGITQAALFAVGLS